MQSVKTGSIDDAPRVQTTIAKAYGCKCMQLNIELKHISNSMNYLLITFSFFSFLKWRLTFL